MHVRVSPSASSPRKYTASTPTCCGIMSPSARRRRPPWQPRQPPFAAASLGGRKVARRRRRRRRGPPCFAVGRGGAAMEFALGRVVGGRGDGGAAAGTIFTQNRRESAKIGHNRANQPSDASRRQFGNASAATLYFLPTEGYARLFYPFIKADGIDAVGVVTCGSGWQPFYARSRRPPRRPPGRASARANTGDAGRRADRRGARGDRAARGAAALRLMPPPGRPPAAA